MRHTQLTLLSKKLSDQTLRVYGNWSPNSNMVKKYVHLSGIDFAEAKKAPDMTDYVSQYRDIDQKIRDNKKSIDDDNKKLEDKSKLSKTNIAIIEKRINDKKGENNILWNQLAEIERLNIESYILDDETQAIFDNALKILTDNYLNTNGVYDVFADNKYRELLVFVDPEDFENSMYGDIDVFIAELENAVEVDVKVIFAKMVLTSHTTTCTSATSPCNPGKGGISVSHQGSTGLGNTVGFKASHPTYGDGFIIAKHEVPLGTEQVVQPLSISDVIGVTQVIGGADCDCAYIQLTGGHTMNDEIWAPDLGSLYPVGVRNTSFTPSGTILVWDGLGSTGHVAEVVNETADQGSLRDGSSPGDSGAAIIKPQVNGDADVYGIATGTTTVPGIGSFTTYEPYDYIKSQLGLTW